MARASAAAFRLASHLEAAASNRQMAVDRSHLGDLLQIIAGLGDGEYLDDDARRAAFHIRLLINAEQQHHG